MFLFALMSLFNTAHAEYVIQVDLYNSSYSGYACKLYMGSSSTSSTSTSTYNVDDVTDESAATCIGAFLANYFGDSVTITTASPYVGLTSSEPGTISYFATNVATGTSSADRCLATLTTTVGSATAYVDDTYEEEDVMCAAIGVLHFDGTSSWTISRASSGEVNYLRY